MLAPTQTSGFSTKVLATIGDTIGAYRPPGIMDGIGAWAWDENTVRLYINHELAPNRGYPWTLENGTQLLGARISWFDIDITTRQVRHAGNAIREIRDRRGETVIEPAQVHERRDRDINSGLNNLCSAQGYQRGTFGFSNDLLFTHEEVTSRQNHPHGGSVWALDVHSEILWALPALGRGSWENVTALQTQDRDADDGHVALLLSDDFIYGGAPLYLWVGRKKSSGSFPEMNGLIDGQLYVWVCSNGDRNPEDWHGTGNFREGKFVAIEVRDFDRAGEPGYDRDGYLDDTTLRARAIELGAFMLSRPEDLHTNPANGLQVVLCSTGHGRKFPSDDWGTIYLIDVQLNHEANELRPSATIRILHDADDFGDHGIRSPDNVVWASDGMIYIHEDKATKLNRFGGETGRESSTWRIDPENPNDYEVIALIDRSAVIPTDARDVRAKELGAWECCGLLDVSRQFDAPNDELLLVTAVQAHTIRGGAIGGRDDLVQGGQLILLSRRS
jgi:secreted PhoX family phosphatase